MREFFKDLLISNAIIVALIWVGYTFFNINGYILIPGFAILALLQTIIFFVGELFDMILSNILDYLKFRVNFKQTNKNLFKN